MKTFQFASVRGNDFVSTGKDVNEAWENLVKKEKDNGSLWKTSDAHRNRAAAAIQGFTLVDLKAPEKGAYKEVTSNTCENNCPDCVCKNNQTN